jgi:diguanylate cyclase (GGDEF)-like protein/PAS domain S-box-containing protein
MTPISLRTLVSAISLFVAIVTAILFQVGYLVVEYSVANTQQLAFGPSVVFVLSCVLAFGVFFTIRIFSLRVIKRTLDALECTQQNLQVQISRYKAAIDNMPQGLILFDAAERLVVCNGRYIEMYGLSNEIVKPGSTLTEVIKHRAERGHLLRDPEQYRAELLAKIHLGKQFNLVVETADGRKILIAGRPMPSGAWLATHDDITERLKAEAEISHMAMHDALTRLPNRLFFDEQMRNRLAHLSRDQKFAVHYLNLDRFKRINDTIGHPLGDNLLRHVAERMNGCLRDGDTLARLGGDEFAVLQGNFNRPNDAIALAARLIEAASAPFDLEGHHVVIGVSIGIAVAPTDAADADQLLKNANTALYRAKADGRGTYRFFETQMDALMQARSALERDLQTALAKGEFELFYQPVANLENNKIVSCEALLRWHHPERGTVSPADFIPVAEEMGLIIPLGEWVLRTACAEAALWPDHVQVAVNVSSSQLTSKNLINVIVGAIASSGIRPNRLELEITESILIQNTSENQSTLKSLHELGVQFAMDDFGTGYSSLGYLLSFPFNRIKIDRSFIAGLPDKKESYVVVGAIAGLARNLGMRVTAEGVETAQQLAQVRILGCTEVQGYFFSRPRPASELRRRFQRNAKDVRDVSQVA